MFDHEQGIALFDQFLEGVEQVAVVAFVESDGRLVENVEDAAEVRSELGGEADALGLAPGERGGGAVEGEVIETDPLHEAEALPDFGEDVGGKGAVVVVENEGVEQLGRVAGAGAGEVGDGTVVDADVAGFGVEAQSLAFRARAGNILVGFLPGLLLLEIGLELRAGLVGLDRTVIDEAEPAAGLAPAVGGVEGEHARVERFEGAGAGGAGHFGAEQFALRAADQACGILADFEGAAGEGDGVFLGGFGDLSDEDIDRVFAVAGEFGKFVRLDQLPVDQQRVEVVPHGPFGDFLVVTLPGFDQRGEDLDWSGLRGGADLIGHLGEGGGGHGDLAGGAVLGAELGVEEAEEVVDFGDGGDGGFAASARDALLDGHGRGESVDMIDVRFFHLLDELAGVGRHAVEEAALAFGKEDVEGEGRFARTAQAGHDDEFVAGNFEGNVFQVVLAGAGDADAVVVRGHGRGHGLGGEEGGFVVLLFEGRFEKGGAAGVFVLRDFFRRAGGDNLSALGAGLGADIDHVVGRFDHFHIVLYNDEGVSGFDQAVENAKEPGDVVEVQSGGRLVEEKERGFGFGVGEAGGKFEAL